MSFATGSKESFITVTKGMSGYFAVMFCWNSELGGFWEPWTTGIGRYATQQEAIEEGIDWAEMQELEFVMPAKPENDLLDSTLGLNETGPNTLSRF